MIRPARGFVPTDCGSFLLRSQDVPVSTRPAARQYSPVVAPDVAPVLFRRGCLRKVGTPLTSVPQRHLRLPCLTRMLWAEVVQLYDALFALAGSPVAAINRAL